MLATRNFSGRTVPVKMKIDGSCSHFLLVLPKILILLDRNTITDDSFFLCTPLVCLYYVFMYCLRCCSFDCCCFSIGWPLGPNKHHLSCLFSCYQHTLSDHTDRCSPFFRSLFKGQNIQTVFNIIDCFSLWQMTVKLTLVLFMFILFLSLIQSQCTHALSVYFCFSSFPLLYG